MGHASARLDAVLLDAPPPSLRAPMGEGLGALQHPNPNPHPHPNPNSHPDQVSTRHWRTSTGRRRSSWLRSTRMRMR